MILLTSLFCCVVFSSIALPNSACPCVRNVVWSRSASIGWMNVSLNAGHLRPFTREHLRSSAAPSSDASSVYWRALGPSARTFWGEFGCATLQPTPEPSHKHFSESFYKFTKTTSTKNRDFAVYHKDLSLAGNATRSPCTTGMNTVDFLLAMRRCTYLHHRWYHHEWCLGATLLDARHICYTFKCSWP